MASSWPTWGFFPAATTAVLAPVAPVATWIAAAVSSVTGGLDAGLKSTSVCSVRPLGGVMPALRGRDRVHAEDHAMRTECGDAGCGDRCVAGAPDPARRLDGVQLVDPAERLDRAGDAVPADEGPRVRRGLQRLATRA